MSANEGLGRHFKRRHSLLRSRQMLLLSSMTYTPSFNVQSYVQLTTTSFNMQSSVQLTTLWVIINYLRTTGNFLFYFHGECVIDEDFFFQPTIFFFVPLGNYIRVNDCWLICTTIATLACFCSLYVCSFILFVQLPLLHTTNCGGC